MKAYMLQKNYIDGTWVASRGKETVPVINPATEEVLAHTPLGTAADVEAAVASAKQAFPGWRKTPATQRIQFLFQLKTLLEKHADELAQIITRENGKTYIEAQGSLRRGIQMLETACGIPTMMMGEYFEDISSGIDANMVHRPLGVFAGITPFNFPMMIPFWFWPFALACGNTFVLKVSERVPLSTTRLFELIHTLNLPKGVLNLVQGGKEVAEALCTHKDVKGLCFVGSTPVAKHVYTLGTSHGKRVQALGGSKNLMVVMPDAMSDSMKDKTLTTAVESITGCAGERCLAGSLLLGVGADVYNELKEGAVAIASKFKVGDGADPKTTMGPLISAEAKSRVIQLIDRAVEEGGKILLDGRAGLENSKGYFLKPTVIAGITPTMEIAQVEVFGPVILLGKVDSLDEAIAWINSLPYGNTTTLFTSSGAHARQFCYEVDPSMIGINIGVPAPMSFFSFGGSKDSFFGDIKAHGKSCVNFFTDSCMTIYRWYPEDNGSIWHK
jgi:malonate-semialdehyde dehydrogenase (acetylating)/methylmalonate-semialdehyde dehydrogenase